MTSSLRNSIHRRNHKERSQLAHRAKLGILEKHSDYVKRAHDYHSKQDRLQRLRQKAADRNKDEFYFSMNKEKTKKGVHVKDRGNVALPTDLVKLLKTQDENYVRTMRATGLKKIDKLKNQLTALVKQSNDEADLDEEQIQVLRDAGIIPRSLKGKGKAKPGHIVFVDTPEEAKKYSSHTSPSISETEDTVPERRSATELGWQAPQLKSNSRKRRKGDEDEDEQPHLSDVDTEPLAHRRRLLQELSARLIRDKYLRYAQREFEMQRLLMGKGTRRKLAGPERLDREQQEDEDEDDLDARKGKRKASIPKVIGMDTYKPRVYKWRIERKR